MANADLALVYYNPDVVKHKKLQPISKQKVFDGFGGNVIVSTETSEVLDFIFKQDLSNTVLLMMSSGNFDGINYDELGHELQRKI